VRLKKEREVDQDLWEALAFSLKDAEDVLSHLGDMHREAAVATERAAEIDRLAGESEERARERVASAERDLQAAHSELKEAHTQRMATKRLHSDAKVREEKVLKAEKAVRLHVHRSRMAVVDWASAKGFDKDMLPELQLMADGGLHRLIEARRRRLPDANEIQALSASEVEAI